MNCEQANEHFADYLVGTLNPDTETALQVHLSACPICAQDADRFLHVLEEPAQEGAVELAVGEGELSCVGLCKGDPARFELLGKMRARARELLHRGVDALDAKPGKASEALTTSRSRDVKTQNQAPSAATGSVASTCPKKLQMLACHASQRDWLRKHHGMDHYVESMRDWSAQQGRHCGVSFAEGFRQHLGHSYPQDNLLGSVLGTLARK